VFLVAAIGHDTGIVAGQRQVADKCGEAPRSSRPYGSFLIFSHRAQQLPVATGTRGMETEKAQAVGLRTGLE
jgi:hypothetical protein